MPYIKDEEKKKFTKFINNLVSYINSKGDLNYVICELVGQYIAQTGVTYDKMSEKIDAVHDAEAELRRRLLDPYEDQKIIDNGDVPSFKTILKIMREVNDRKLG